MGTPRCDIKMEETINGQLMFGKQSENMTHQGVSTNQTQMRIFEWETKMENGKMGRWVLLDHLRGPAAGSHWCEPPWTHGARRPSRRREEGGREGGREEKGGKERREETGRGRRLTAEQPTGLYDRTEGGGGAARCRPHSHQNVLLCPKKTKINKTINKQTNKTNKKGNIQEDEHSVTLTVTCPNRDAPI